jgi:hypothetical protein
LKSAFIVALLALSGTPKPLPDDGPALCNRYSMTFTKDHVLATRCNHPWLDLSTAITGTEEDMGAEKKTSPRGCPHEDSRSSISSRSSMSSPQQYKFRPPYRFLSVSPILYPPMLKYLFYAPFDPTAVPIVIAAFVRYKTKDRTSIDLPLEVITNTLLCYSPD